MKLFFIYMILAIALLLIGINSIREICDGNSSVDGFVAKKHVSFYSSDSFLNYKLVCTYSLMKESLSPVKQVDVQDNDKNVPANTYLKRTESDYKADSLKQVKITSDGNYARFLSGRHMNGFYIYSFGQLII